MCVLLRVGECDVRVCIMCASRLNQVNSHVSLSVINIFNITLSLSVCLILFCASLFLYLLLYFCPSLPASVWSV